MEKYVGWVPQEPDYLVRQFAAKTIKKEFCIFKTEWVDRMMFLRDPAEGEKVKKEKMARCVCSACQTEYYADLIEELDPSYGIKEIENDENVLKGMTFLCPYCGTPVELAHVSQFGHSPMMYVGSAKILDVMKNGEKVAFVIWYAEKQVDKKGTTYIRIERWRAYLPDGKKMTKLSGQQRFYQGYWIFDEWQEMKRCDITDICGMEIMPFDKHFLDGTEFENAKLDIYVKTENPAPIAYACAYQNWPQIENIVTSGCGELFSTAVRRASEKYTYNYNMVVKISKAGIGRLFDFKKVKPHEMIGVKKEELRELKEVGLTIQRLDRYKSLKDIDQRFTAEDAVKIKNPDEIREIAAYVDPVKAVRYLQKNKYESGYYMDYLRARLTAGLPLETQIDLFPRDLQRKHDEAVETMNAIKKKEKAELFQKAFEEWTARFSQTAYKADGLSVFICPTAEDMQAEGKTLHHCVASYIEPHAAGESFIFFVRRARRPERSYYTLNIEITDGKAKEIQLHGYRNDAKRKIPPEVRAFVDRWKREILIPFCQKENRRKTA